MTKFIELKMEQMLRKFAKHLRQILTKRGHLQMKFFALLYFRWSNSKVSSQYYQLVCKGFEKQQILIKFIGMVPVNGYDEQKLSGYVDTATELKKKNIKTLILSGDNAPQHRSYFKHLLCDNLRTDDFPLCDWPYGQNSMLVYSDFYLIAKSIENMPIPLQDYHHLFRKLVSPLCKGSKFLVIGTHVVAKAVLIEAHSVLRFPDSFINERDEQNDERVLYFLTNSKVIHKLI